MRIPAAGTREGERLGIYLLCALLAGWLITMVVIQVVMVHNHGYGGGPGPRHVPPELARETGLGQDASVDELMKATNKP